jgi:hypothetical protein
MDAAFQPLAFQQAIVETIVRVRDRGYTAIRKAILALERDSLRWETTEADRRYIRRTVAKELLLAAVEKGLPHEAVRAQFRQACKLGFESNFDAALGHLAYAESCRMHHLIPVGIQSLEVLHRRLQEAPQHSGGSVREALELIEEKIARLQREQSPE